MQHIAPGSGPLPGPKAYCLRRMTFFLCFFSGLSVASAVQADVLARVKAEGAVRCGSVERPGLAEPDLAGKVETSGWRGLNAEICRAIGIAALGPSGRFEFHRYETQQDYDSIRQGMDEVFFLTASEIIAQNLTDKLIPGPAVYYETHALMVRNESRARHIEDLEGAKICFMTGSGAQRSLESFFEAKRLPFLRVPFSEEDEMRDAYRAGRCDALAGELTALARLRLDEYGRDGRILPQPLAVFPVMACTGTADGKWAAIVAWTVHTLLRADTREGSWRAGGAKALPIDGAGLGLDPAWQQRLIDRLGSYSDLYRRTLGGQSVYGLEQGLNAPAGGGGFFVAPYSE